MIKRKIRQIFMQRKHLLYDIVDTEKETEQNSAILMPLENNNNPSAAFPAQRQAFSRWHYRRKRRVEYGA
jgi:hypothetical protein